MRAVYSMFMILLSGTLASAGEWPQWLGPQRNASSLETVAPWKDIPKLLWRQPVGEGHSSPIVADGKVFLHTKVKDKEEERLTAFDAKTGKEVWQAAYPRAEFKSMFGNGPRATPCVSGKHVFTFGATGILTCWHVATGRQLWQVDTLKKFEAKNLFFGVSCSPIVVDNKVLVNIGGKGASIVAFNTDTGKVAWKVLDDPASYSSPILIEGPGLDTRQVIFLTQKGLVSLQPKDGSVKWKFPLVDLLNESSPTPVQAGELVIGSSITYGAVAVTCMPEEKVVVGQQVWQQSKLSCYFSTPVAVGKDTLYMVTGQMVPPQATLRCVETKTGKELWHQPKVGKYHASLLRTGDNKLLMLDDSGNLIFLDANPKEYRELARAKVCGEAWAHPALSDGRLYLRDNKELICLQLGK